MKVVSVIRLAVSAAVLLTAISARADTYFVTLTNLVFSATCVGGGPTCTETINGTGYYDPITNTASDLNVQMTGTLNASLDGFGSPTCTNAMKCLPPPILYDLNALTGYNPIELSPIIMNFDSPTPTPLGAGSGPNATELFIPGMCGGDQPNCNTPGSFPGGADYFLTSGSYTSVDVSTPEPDSTYLVSGAALLWALCRVSRRREPTCAPARQKRARLY